MEMTQIEKMLSCPEKLIMGPMKEMLNDHGTPIAHAALGAGAILGGAHLLKRTGQAIARPYDERVQNTRAQSAAIHGARGLQFALGARPG